MHRLTPDPRLARLLQPLTGDSLGIDRPTLDVTIELAHARAAMSTMGAALHLIALRDRDAITTSIAQDAIERALKLIA